MCLVRTVAFAGLYSFKVASSHSILTVNCPKLNRLEVRTALAVKQVHSKALRGCKMVSKESKELMIETKEECVYLWGFFTPPVAGADLRAALVASCFLGALPPVDLRAVCLVRAMMDLFAWLFAKDVEGSEILVDQLLGSISRQARASPTL